MDDSTAGKMASSLIIPEKPTHRPGGCVGIFFQLFDWKRRFAKKKLFSQKMLPPSRAKQLLNKFGDDKMPISRLHLIADEKSGNLKKNSNYSCASGQKQELRAPGLVARLMGLEYMPAAHEKPHNTQVTHACDGRRHKEKIKNQNVSDRQELLEKGEAKPESRPQKLQKMGLYDKTAVTRFGAESLQVKSVLPRSRKHHQHQKLASPVKSSKISSGKTASRTSRLIGAATKILDPGLQSTNRAKCALISSFHHPQADATLAQSPDVSKKTHYDTGKGNSPMGQTCCKECGNLLHVPDLTSRVEEQQHVFPSYPSNITNSCSLLAEQSRPSISSFAQEKDSIFQRTRNQPLSVSGQKNIRTHGKPFKERKAPSPESQASCQLSSQPYKPHRYQMQHPMSLGKERIPPRYKLNNLDSRRASSAAIRGTKDFIDLNQSLSNRTCPMVPTKGKDSKFERERKAFIGKDDSPFQLRTSIRKRRMIHVSGRVTNTGIVTSTTTIQRNTQFGAPAGTGLGNGADLMSQTCANSELADKQDGNRAYGNTDTDVMSFTFNSSITSKTGISAEMEGTGMDNDGKIYFQKPLSLSGDAIGLFLEQKLRELACLEDDDLAIGASSKRSTAMIHDGLISSYSQKILTAKGKPKKSAGTSLDGDHLSPGSVLEASFSSSSMDDSSGRRSFYPISLDYPDDHLQAQGYDADLTGSATAGGRKKTSREMMITLVNNVCRILHSINADGERVRRRKLTHACEIILNAELLFGDATMHNMDGMEGSFMSPFLRDLETIASSRMTSFNMFGGLEDIEKGSQLDGLFFDCVIEYIDSKYAWYCNAGFRYWKELALSMNQKLIFQEVEEEIKKWTRLPGMISDEIVAWEMSHSFRKWTEFDIEAFEAGSEIDGDIFQTLVNEIAIDLWECSIGSL
ncbi:hypothetical protein RchiOBHm_Chr2g0126071 [Rosa chinensis]|uniref:DUF4378 domain-containing protein n=1 Tax=Rosa chinensis TaxID=74649 RepID=A0A2P6RTS7_ROSCH|nr:uncharacterized protein LOC112188040 [Rosa chinensis]PRQ49812.1 hypothetical protein RchiOBHm_Chr2g0126071 [Rosa chinensis]